MLAEAGCPGRIVAASITFEGIRGIIFQNCGLRIERKRDAAHGGWIGVGANVEPTSWQARHVNRGIVDDRIEASDWLIGISVDQRQTCHTDRCIAGVADGEVERDWVAGAAAGIAARIRSGTQRMCAIRWNPIQIIAVVAANQRIWCNILGRENRAVQCKPHTAHRGWIGVGANIQPSGW